MARNANEIIPNAYRILSCLIFDMTGVSFLQKSPKIEVKPRAGGGLIMPMRGGGKNLATDNGAIETMDEPTT